MIPVTSAKAKAKAKTMSDGAVLMGRNGNCGRREQAAGGLQPWQPEVR